MASEQNQARPALPAAMTPSDPRAGFTLMEVMVAVVIIAIAMVSVYKLQAQTILTAGSARFYATAPMLARIKLADIDIKSLEDVDDDSGDFGEDFPGYTWKIATDEIASENLKEEGPSLKRIDIQILFNEGESVFSFSTYRLDH